MAYGEQCEEIVQYLDKLNIYYEKEKSLVNCGNFVIDAMMNSKYLIACKENIKHEDRIVVPEAMNFEDVDLCILWEICWIMRMKLQKSRKENYKYFYYI